jgi:hypothetical protein
MSTSLCWGYKLTLLRPLPASETWYKASLVCLRDSSLSPFSPGALSEWLADHPVMINSVLPLVLHALGNPELSVSSVSTLKKICRECKYDLPPYAANIVAVSQVGGSAWWCWASGCTALH